MHTKALSTVLFFVLPAVGFGCSSHSLRDGVWEISYQVQRVESRVQAPIDPMRVKVHVEWGKSDDDGNRGEEVEIKPLGPKEGAKSKKSTKSLQPMFGDIAPVDDGRNKILKIEHRDPNWYWRMAGKIINPELVSGTSFLARSHRFENLRLEGRWMMKWVGEE